MTAADIKMPTSGKDKEELPEAKKEKVPRPPNAFILYRQHHHAAIKAMYPGLRNTKLCKYLPHRLDYD